MVAFKINPTAYSNAWSLQNMTILIGDILQVSSPERFKLHFARSNQYHQPLDVFVRDRREWQTWQEYRPHRDEFSRPYIFSLIQFYHETDIWLFGGVFRVLGRHSDRYDVELTDEWKNFIGRLKLKSPYRGRTTRVNMENHVSQFEVREILAEPYSGRAFPGYEEIDLSFNELETILMNGRADWKAALENIKGVYVISDVNTGKRYVGSAYGAHGIWSRWNSYIATGHGGNIELRKLTPETDIDYCRRNFRFALLEYRPEKTDDNIIISREGFWKELLMTRGQYGFNRN
jgi:hypothetical protein